jgi:hypothetical protein
MYIGCDPGDPTGLAKVNDRGQVLEVTQVSLDGLAVYLEAIPTVAVRGVVSERFKLLPFKSRALSARKNNKGEVVQAEGIIKSWCDRHGIRLHWQYATILPMGSRHSGIKMPSDHSLSHGPAAAIHVLEWMYRHDLAKTALELQLEREQENRA